MNGRSGAGDLPAAARDYLWLLDRGYPERPSVSLVGDRFRLGREQRLMLYRGVCSRENAARRRSRLGPPPQAPGAAVEAGLAMDGYNVLFTILNYRNGKPVFIGLDGFARDAGGLHGRIEAEGLLEELAAELAGFLRELGFRRVDVWLDKPVSRSGEHAAVLRRALAAAGLEGAVEVCASADYGVKNSGAPLIASSDTGIIDACQARFFDCALAFIESRYRAVPFSFQDTVGIGPDSPD